MGYRSEVVVILTKKEYKSMLKLFDDKFGKDDDHLLTPNGCDKISIRDDYVVLEYDDVKWYTSYRAISYLYKVLDGENDEVAIIRIGEDIDDIIFEGDWDILCETSIYPYSTIDRGDSSKDIIVDSDMLNELRKSTPQYVIQFGNMEDGANVW